MIAPLVTTSDFYAACYLISAIKFNFAIVPKAVPFDFLMQSVLRSDCQQANYRAISCVNLSAAEKTMMWQFEWNWLGYLWAFFVGFPLTYGTLLACVEGRDAARGNTPTGSVYGYYYLLIIGAAFAPVLGLLTIFIWDFKTALVLTGGALAWFALALPLRGITTHLVQRVDSAFPNLRKRQQDEYTVRGMVMDFVYASMPDDEYAGHLRSYVASHEETYQTALRERIAHDESFHALMKKNIPGMVFFLRQTADIEKERTFSVLHKDILSVTCNDSSDVRDMRLHYLSNPVLWPASLSTEAKRMRFEKRIQSFKADYLKQHPA